MAKQFSVDSIKCDCYRNDMGQQGDVLAEWRLEHGWTQAEAARRMGVTRAAWQAWENGAPPGLPNAVALERFTDGAVTAAAWAKPRRKHRRAKHHPAA